MVCNVRVQSPSLHLCNGELRHRLALRPSEHPSSVTCAKARIVLMPPDVELFALGTGGVSEPMAQWTEQACDHLLESLRRRQAATLP